MKKILDFMAEDHYRLNGVLKEFQSTWEQNRRKARDLFADFAAGLQRHLAWEEEVLFPLIECRTGMHLPGPSVTMRVEHQQLKTLLATLQEEIRREGKGLPVSTEGLIERFSLHGKREEEILYPWIEMTLTEKERGEALRKMSEDPEGWQ
ncbi:MAG: hemerythrin domain-containing protein [Candidatus Manganitrophaceae bacterium]